MLGLQCGKCGRQYRGRTNQSSSLFKLTAHDHFSKIILHHAPIVQSRFADNDVAETNVDLISGYRAGYAAANTHHEADPEFRETASHVRCHYSRRSGAVLSCWEAGHDNVVGPYATKNVRVVVSRFS